MTKNEGEKQIKIFLLKGLYEFDHLIRDAPTNLSIKH